MKKQNLLTLYILTLVGLIVLFPNFVSDGHSSIFTRSSLKKLQQDHIIHGIDISKHNGELEWAKVKAHTFVENPLDFVFIKATEGGDLVDAYFMENWNQAKKHNLTRGAYHFFIPNTDPEVQAINYLATVKHESGDFVPILDFEQDAVTRFAKENLTQNALIWLQVIEEETGKKPVIYTNHRIYNRYIKNKIFDYDIWLADYSVYSTSHHDIKNLIMWQLSDGGVIPGIKGTVDLNVFYGTPYRFKKYLFK